MARRLNLQEYQESILARLKSQGQAQDGAPASRLGVQIGDDAWLMSLSDVGEVLPVPEIQPVPLTRPWFMGMANVRGNLYAVTDLSAFLGGRPARLGVESRLLLAGGRFGINAAFVIDRLFGLRNIAEMHLDAGQGRAPWQSRTYLDASARRWCEMEMAALLGSGTFMQVAA